MVNTNKTTHTPTQNPFQQKLRINFKIWYEYFENGKWIPILGEKKIELLKALQSTESLNMASRKLNLDYKKAWDMIHHLNSCEFCTQQNISLITQNQEKGRKSGIRLSQTGKLIVQIYEQIEQAINQFVSQINQEYFQI